jgi:hypothetical protein
MVEEEVAAEVPTASTGRGGAAMASSCSTGARSGRQIAPPCWGQGWPSMAGFSSDQLCGQRSQKEARLPSSRHKGSHPTG